MTDVKIPSKIDYFIHRWLSKKLFVFLLSTVLLIVHTLTAEQWYYITILYIGGQHAHDMIMNWKGGPFSTLNSNNNG